jgi:hypothetical protein
LKKLKDAAAKRRQRSALRNAPGGTEIIEEITIETI